ncbi:MAG: glutamate-5-semialdehyde dehydrogenase [Pseudomonadota bacterium]|nr:glutamate-5-semialdehyde dehydrogenase [Pseudomonadota bacterium]MEE3260920.1 glutamate-5-semialdehyde dehydrogenase [Pseudomonadota bacterium]
MKRRRNIKLDVENICKASKQASLSLSTASTSIKNGVLEKAAKNIHSRSKKILTANGRDMFHAKKEKISEALLDRLELNMERVEAMSKGLKDVARLQDPVGKIIAAWERPNGLKISRVRVPIGTIAIIYESRPNVTADAAGLSLKSGNSSILRCGSESLNSSTVIAECLRDALKSFKLPANCVQLIPTKDRQAVAELLKMDQYVDIIVPRGGRGLIERVLKESRIPVIRHLDGICHVYVHSSANLNIARKIVLNAKMRRPGICGAAETLLIDENILDSFLPPILDDLIRSGCEVRGGRNIRSLDPRVKKVKDVDWDTEYLDAIISVKSVSDVSEAIDHISKHGSQHTDSIISSEAGPTKAFLQKVDSGIVMHNTSTQFADGGEFGMGAEIGISTGKLHARGPVGAEQLTTYKYIVKGNGQTRP